MSYPVRLTVDYPERLSKLMLIVRLCFGWAYVGIPHGFCLAIYSFLAVFVMIAAWITILFTGDYPRNMFDFVVGLHRWQARVWAYLTFLTDVYPPFNGAAEANAPLPPPLS